MRCEGRRDDEDEAETFARGDLNAFIENLYISAVTATTDDMNLKRVGYSNALEKEALNIIFRSHIIRL